MIRFTFLATSKPIVPLKEGREKNQRVLNPTLT